MEGLDVGHNWRWCIASDVTEVVLGKTLRREEYVDEGSHRVLKFRDVLNGSIDIKPKPRAYAAENPKIISSLRPVQEDDVLLTASAHSSDQIGKKCAHITSLPPSPSLYFSGELICFRPRSELMLGRWLYHWFRSRPGLHHIQEAVAGVHLTKGRAAEIPIPLPPIAEQHRLVAFLDQAIAPLEDVLPALIAAEKGARQLRAKVIARFFQESQRWIEASKRVGLGSLVSHVTSGSRGWARYYADEGDAFIRVGNLDHDSIELDLRNVQSVSPPDNAESKRTCVAPGDVLVSITAEVGMIAVVPESFGRAFVNQHVALVRPTSEIDSRFLAWFLASPEGQKQLRRRERGATKVGLGLDDIKEVEVPVPDRNTQESIAGTLDTAIAELDDVETTAMASRSRALLLGDILLNRTLLPSNHIETSRSQ